MNIERLEPRTLFTAVLPFTFAQNGGLLTITGADTSLGDQIQVTQVGGVVTATDIRAGASKSTSGAAITSIVVDLRSGDDYLRASNNDGTKPVTVPMSIYGGLGNDTIYGGSGNDYISGGDGNDKLVGRGGSDNFDGGSGFDTVDYSYETRAMNISIDNVANDGVIDTSSASGNQNEKDNVSTSIEAVVGGSGNDVLIGSGAADWLDGGPGNDTIAGGAGNDTITGGIGADTVFGQTGSDADFIKDGTVDGSGDTFELAQVDSKSAGAKVNDIGVSATIPTGIANPAFKLLGNGITPALSISPEPTDPASPANLDTTFGTGGESLTDLINLHTFGCGTFGDVSVVKVLLQPEIVPLSTVSGPPASTDKIIVVGTILDNFTNSNDLFVMRLNPDGSLDTTFGDFDHLDSGNNTINKGYTITDLGAALGLDGTNDRAASALIDPEDDAIVVAATTDINPSTSGDDFAIVRYTHEGQLDTTFGQPIDAENNVYAGVATYDFSQGGNTPLSDDTATGITLAHEFDGFESGYVLAGTTTADFGVTQNIAVARFDLAGNADTSGFNQVDTDDGNTAATGIVEDSRGGFWISANQLPGDGISVGGVVGFDSFGFFGSEFDIGLSNGTTTNLAISADGTKLAVVGQDYDSGDGYIGDLEVVYSEGTYVQLNNFNIVFGQNGGQVIYRDVAFDGSDRPVAVGTVGSNDQFNGDADYIVTRLGSDFLGDGSFNPPLASVFIDMRPPADDGFGNIVNSLDNAYGVAIQDDGGIVVAGTNVYSNNPGVIGVVRLLGGDHIADNTIPDDQSIPDLQDQFTWTDPDTGVITTIPAELFERAELPVTPTPVQVDGTDGDNFISVTQFINDAGDNVIRVINDGSVRDWDARYVSEIDINTHGGTDTVLINDVPMSEGTDDFAQITIPINITGGENHLKVITSPQNANVDGQYVQDMTDADSNNQLGSIARPTGADEPVLDPITGDVIDNSLVYEWTAGDNIGTETVNYDLDYSWDTYHDYQTDGSFNVTLVQTNSAPVATDDTLADQDNSASFTIDPADLIANDSPGPASESGQTVSFVDAFTSSHPNGNVDGDGNLLYDVDGGTASYDQGTGLITFTPTPGYTGPATFTYEIKDDGTTDGQPDSLTALGTVTFNLFSSNHAPTDLAINNSSSASIAENTPGVSAIGTFSTTDQDAGDTFTYSLVDNLDASPNAIQPHSVPVNDNSFFSITNANGVGTLQANGPFDFEAKNSYTIFVRSTDAGGKFFTKSLTINVTNVNEAPTANAGGPYSVTQGATVALTGLASSDPEQAAGTLTYKWDLDGDGVFGETAISNTGGIANGDETGATPTYIATASTPTGNHTIGLQVFDNGNLTSSTTAVVNVTAAVQPGTLLLGTVTNGRSGSGNTPDKAFDGNPNTFNSGPSSPTMDFGTARSITKISFIPRNNMGWKMVLGRFQVSNDASFRTGVVTLYTVPLAGPPGGNGVSTVNVSAPGTYRYFRFISVLDLENSVAEISAFGSPGGGVDKTAPSKPGTPKATGQTYTSVSFAWDTAYDYAGVDHYDVYRGNTKIGTTTNLFFTDTGAVGGPLKAGTAYSYSVRAIDAAGNSTASSAASLKTLVDKVKPSQPLNLHVVNGSLTKTSVTLAWNASTDDIAVVGYYIFRNGKKVGTTSSLTFNNTGLKTKTKYTYTVQAYDSAGNVSLLSAALVVTTV